MSDILAPFAVKCEAGEKAHGRRLSSLFPGRGAVVVHDKMGRARIHVCEIAAAQLGRVIPAAALRHEIVKLLGTQGLAVGVGRGHGEVAPGADQLETETRRLIQRAEMAQHFGKAAAAYGRGDDQLGLRRAVGQLDRDIMDKPLRGKKGAYAGEKGPAVVIRRDIEQHAGKPPTFDLPYYVGRHALGIETSHRTGKVDPHEPIMGDRLGVDAQSAVFVGMVYKKNAGRVYGRSL